MYPSTTPSYPLIKLRSKSEESVGLPEFLTMPKGKVTITRCDVCGNDDPAFEPVVHGEDKPTAKKTVEAPSVTPEPTIKAD